MNPEDDPGRPSRRGTLVAVVVLLLLAFGGWWVANRLHQTSVLQDCVMQGRRNCAPVN